MNDETFDDQEMSEEGSFAEMFEQSMVGKTKLEPGQKIDAKVLQIGSEWIFLDVGQKGEGVLDSRELLDEEGNLTVSVGDRVSAYFLSGKGGELRFTTRLGGGSSGTAQLEEAWRSEIPVEGRIEKEIKGGYEIKLPGNVRAFCPFSQLGLRRQDDSEDVTGTTLSFRVTQFSEQGRNIVVSHRVILDEERRQQRAELMKTLKEGMVVTGTITNIRDFGAFIDIGGLEGLLPISEISYGRVDKIEDVLHIGQQLDVAVKKCDWEKERFSFSLRDTLANPWAKVATAYPVGSIHTGTVSRLAQFGAFVTLEEGIDGLMHISRIGGEQRIKHPQDVLKLGQQLQVTVEKVDLDEKRISLAPVGDKTDESEETSYEEKTTGGMGSFADLFKNAQKKK
ncbi:MAG: 30S ribosomal protein S1 [Desulfuromonadales bacterium]|nr:30S ribosomal protein S1 [Desulfuromonadales bacterium]